VNQPGTAVTLDPGRAYCRACVAGRHARVVRRMSTVASVSIDYSPACGTSAVVTGQYFAANGSWRTRIADVGDC
jgi:hypothetical protein